MQFGHGNEYMESFGLFNSIPFESLCALIPNMCLLNVLHLTIQHNIHRCKVTMKEWNQGMEWNEGMEWNRNVIPDVGIVKVQC